MDKHFRLARIFTDLLENKFSLGKFKFGLDPVIGAMPGVGDLITLCISLYLVWIGIKIRIPQEKIIEMASNVLVDFLIGLFPVIGDLTDVVFKANSRNIKILEEYRSKVVEAEVIK